jgi:hypothetical protein
LNIIMAAGALVAGVGCGDNKLNTAVLYGRLGGEPGITTVMTDFVGRVADIDAIVNAVTPLNGDIVEDVANDGTVYQRVGRKPAIATVADNFITRGGGRRAHQRLFWPNRRRATGAPRHLSRATGLQHRRPV